MDTGPFIHMVFFWLKEPQNPGQRVEFEVSLKKFLHNSLHATGWHVGTPAGTNRPVIDSSYTYCLIVTFPSVEAHDEYQKEDAHLLFIKESSRLWERVQIYDSMAIG